MLCGLILSAVAIQAIWLSGLARGDDLLAWSNYGQLASALLCVVLSAYLFVGKGERIYVFAGFAFAGWFLSNTFWYLYVQLIDRSLVYPSISDAGFLGFMLLLIAAISLTYEKRLVRKETLLVYAAFLLPGIAGLWLSPTFASVVTLTYYLCFAVTVAAVVEHYSARDWLFFGGILLYCLAMLMYVSREVYFSRNLLFTMVGQLIIVAFCVTQLGLLRRAGHGRLQP